MEATVQPEATTHAAICFFVSTFDSHVVPLNTLVLLYNMIRGVTVESCVLSVRRHRSAE